MKCNPGFVVWLITNLLLNWFEIEILSTPLIRWLFLLAFCNLGYRPENLVSGQSRARCLPVADRKCTNSDFFFLPSYSYIFGIWTRPVNLVFGHSMPPAVCRCTNCTVRNQFLHLLVMWACRCWESSPFSDP